VPAIADAFIPGVGHLLAGRRRRALLFLSPTLVALAAAVWIPTTKTVSMVSVPRDTVEPTPAPTPDPPTPTPAA
jgi:hypothetical protein